MMTVLVTIKNDNVPDPEADQETVVVACLHEASGRLILETGPRFHLPPGERMELELTPTLEVRVRLKETLARKNSTPLASAAPAAPAGPAAPVA